MTKCIPQLTFSFYRRQLIHADFSGGQITSDAGLLPLRAFDQRHGLTRALAQHLKDPRQGGRVRHSSLSLVRQRVYQIVAGYEDANDADRLRHDPAFQLLADQPLGQPSIPSPPSVAGKTRPRPASLSALTMAGSMASYACAESRFGYAAKSCSTSIPPTIPPTDSNS